MNKRDDYKKISDIIGEFSDNTNIHQYLNGLLELNNQDSQELFEKKYLPIIDSEKKQKTPFLSVIMRTQGKREDGLREALLCLNAQSNQNFEIILIAHKTTQEQEHLIENILNEQEENFRKKIRFYRLSEGTRTTPLNFGFAHAWGEYAAIFDDDDILFDNWVESFFQCSQKNRGRILHSYAFAQNWENINSGGYRATSAPVANYCMPFDILAQLSVNRCPLMTLAFPLNIFQKVGIIFNENLNVMEDWEYFMKVAFLCGVSDIEEPTAIYRFWQNLETSATLHDQNAWDDTYRSIQKSFDKQGVILPPGQLKRIIDITVNGTGGLINEKNQNLSRLYISKGEPFSDLQVIESSSQEILPRFEFWFLFEEKSKDFKALRFDLFEEGLFVLNQIDITVWFTNGEKRVVSLNDCIHNGFEKGDSLLFINKDPEIIWEWSDERLIDVVHVSGQISRSIPSIRLLNTLVSLLPVKKCFKKKQLHKKGLF